MKHSICVLAALNCLNLCACTTIRDPGGVYAVEFRAEAMGVPLDMIVVDTSASSEHVERLDRASIEAGLRDTYVVRKPIRIVIVPLESPEAN